MKILMLTPYLPYPLLSGGQIRTYNLLKQLSNKHEITLFSLIKEDHERQFIPELEKYCHQVKVFRRPRKPFTLKSILTTAFSSYPFLVIRNFSKAAKDAIQEELKTHQFDLIHAETFYMMPHLPKTDIPIFLVEQTIEYLGYESYAQKAPKILKPLLMTDIEKIKDLEYHYWQNCTKLIVMSQADQELVSKIVDKEKTAVVENGVDVGWFQVKRTPKPKQPTVLSVGTFNWLPNVEATRFLVKKVWPKIQKKNKDARLWIVGNNPTPEVIGYANDPSITVTGGIPDIRDAFQGAHVLLAPVFSGKGTRYKILEAMASGTAIVATPTAVEGLGVTHDKDLLIGKTAEELANETLSLLADSEKQTKFAKHGKNLVSQQYDWHSIAQRLSQLYLSVK